MAQRERVELRPGDSDPLAYAVAQNDARTLDMVRAALEARRLKLAFQPVVETRRPGRTAFHEGLIRILDPQDRIIPAADFMGVVEQEDLGRQIDCAALEIGLGVLRRHPVQRLSLNMSARSIGYPRFNAILARALAAQPALGPRLILEITEGSAMQVPELVSAFMARLQRQGVTFALDRFGAGATVLRRLADLDFDLVKIDGRLVRGIDRSADLRHLAEGLAMLARHFGMATVAESVETAEAAAVLSAIGVDCLQGWHVGAPSLRPAFMAEGARRRA